MDEHWRLKIIDLNTLWGNVDRHIKTKIKAYGDKSFTNFLGLNVQEDDFWIFCNLFYWFFSCLRKQVLLLDEEIIDCFDENPFETDED